MARARHRCINTLDLFMDGGIASGQSPLPPPANDYRPLVQRSDSDLASMVRALSIHSWLNTPEEQRRLSMARVEVDHRRRGVEPSPQSPEKRILRLSGNRIAVPRHH
jgi:hypothetical protein